MKVHPFTCDCCPGQDKDLMLIETRFKGQRCFAELECKVCKSLWTAELGSTPNRANPSSSLGEDQPGWRVLGLRRRFAN